MAPGEDIASFVIVTYNSAHIIASCLEPLRELAESGHEIVIVDNNSTDDTTDVCITVLPRVKLIKNRVNEGFAKAVNIGVSSCKGSVVILLNPDAIGTTQGFQQLIKASLVNPDAIIAPLIVHPENRLKVVSAGRLPYLRRMFLHYSGISRLAGPKFIEGHYLFPHQVRVERDVEWATGACLAIPRQIWISLEGMTERWFMYAEDIEFCHRVLSAGYAIRLMPEIRVSHTTGTGTSEPKSMKADWIVNLWHFYNDDLSRSRVLSEMWKVVVATGLASRATYYALRGVRSSESHVWNHEAQRFWAFCSAVLRAK